MRRLLVGLAIASIAALSPCWVHADDQQIAQQIVQQLRQQKADGRLTGFGIDLEVESGIVWLKGHVTTAEQQQLVLDIARRVDGVEQVVNDLSVKAAPTERRESEPQVRPALLKSGGESKVLQKPGQLLGNLNRSMKRALHPEKETPQRAQPTWPQGPAAPSVRKSRRRPQPQDVGPDVRCKPLRSPRHGRPLRRMTNWRKR